MTSPTASLRDDARTIVLVGLAHGTSHFFHMLLPPLFPLFIRDFGLSYAELGLLVSTFFVISGIGQALAGFLVDRVGARPVLFAALSCFVLAALAAATAQGYAGLMLAAALAGLGNAPFHPVDFTILNKRVSQPRLGHAFSVHGISGNLGWAAAPVFMAALTAATGSWRWAAAGAAAWALLVLAILVVNRRSVDDRSVSWPHAAPGQSSPATTTAHPLAFLRLPSVWLCFVTGFMLCGAAGMVVGGFLAARGQRLERTIGACLLGAALLLFIAGLPALPGLLAAALAALAGFGTGLAGPSRDMLIKRAAPPGATGRVYGTVYSGLDLGFALAAPVFGAILDHGSPSGVFSGAALALVGGVVSAALVGVRVARGQGGAAKMPA